MTTYYCGVITKQNYEISINNGFNTFMLHATTNNIIVNLPNISKINGLVYTFIRTDKNDNLKISLNPYYNQKIDNSFSVSIDYLGTNKNTLKIISYEYNWYSF